MKETILIIMFLSIVIIFIFIHSTEVSFQESFTGEQYLVRNLDDKDKAADMLSSMKTRLKKLVDYIDKRCQEDNLKELILLENITTLLRINLILYYLEKVLIILNLQVILLIREKK